MSTQCYQPSGRLTPLAVVYLIILTPVVFVAATVYAALARALPVPGVVGCACVALGCTFGWLLRRIAMRGKVRNPTFMCWAGAAIGLLGWYWQWSVWIGLAIASRTPEFSQSSATPILSVAGDPWLMLKLANGVASSGAKGPALVLWFFEFLVLVLVPALGGWASASNPFCEVSGEWAKKIILPRRFSFVEDSKGFYEALLRDTSTVLDLLGRFPDDARYATVTLYQCAGEISYIEVENITMKTANGPNKTSRTAITGTLVLRGIGADELVRRCAEPDLDPPDPPELRAAIEHVQNQRYEATLTEALPYIESDQVNLRTDALRLCALACSRLERRAEALRYFHALFPLEPTAHNALQLASGSVMVDDVPQGEHWFARAKELQAQTGEPPALTIETNFVTALKLRGHMAQALPYLDRIRQAYQELHVTDPTYLFARQFPQFDSFLSNSYAVLREALPENEVHAWYASMTPHLDDDGKAQIAQWINAGMKESEAAPQVAAQIAGTAGAAC